MPAPSTGRNPQKNTWGGFSTASFYSGGQTTSLPQTACLGQTSTAPIGSGLGDWVLQSGPGRLDYVVPYNLASGFQQVIFYDAAISTAASGGPYLGSGHKVVGLIPGNNAISPAWFPSGTQVQIPALPGAPLQVSVNFTSGLIVSLNKSGSMPSFTANWTPEPGFNY